MANVSRTSMNLDRDLVREAQAALGTRTVVETVHVALENAVQRERRMLAWDRIGELVDWEALDDLLRAEGDY